MNFLDTSLELFVSKLMHHAELEESMATEVGVSGQLFNLFVEG